MNKAPRLPTLIIAAYAALALLYALVTPMFEAPDENFHYAFIGRLAQSPDLPVQDPAVYRPWFQEGSQPPLYYYLSALVVRLLTPGEVNILTLARNPHAAIGVGLADINNNAFLHAGPGIALDEALQPVSWYTPAFLGVRLLSIALGAVTLLALYRSVRLAVPEQPGVALLALGFAAFNPMFLFMNASVNNDNLVSALAAVALWLMLLILTRGLTPARVGLLAVTLALASLSKLSGLTLYGVAGALLLVLLLKQRATFRQVVIAGLALVAAFGLIAAWWYIRNLTLYGELTGTRTMIAIIGARTAPYTIYDFLTEMDGLRISFWALFGWFNVIGPLPFLVLMDALTALALIGGIGWVVGQFRAGRAESLLPIGLLALHFGITFVSLITWTAQTPGTQGRLLFPALTGIATLTALGWTALFRRLRPALGFLPLLPMIAAAVLCPPLIIAPAYAPPPVLAALPDDATPVDVRFETLQVRGYRIDPAPRRPGEALPVTVYYSGEPDRRNLSLYLNIVQDGAPVGKIDSYPGGGNLPTAALQSGAIYADTYRIPVDPAADVPVRPAIEFGWWDFATQARLTPTQDGAPLNALILRGGVLIGRDAPPSPDVRQTATFSGVLRLHGYTLRQTDEVITVTLVWEALAPVYEDFNVLVHLTGPDSAATAPLAQGDSAPRGGRYPTSAWVPTRPFADTYTIRLADVPPGRYDLRIGLYRLRDFSRLPVEAERTAGDTLLLDTPIEVKR